MCAKRVNNKSQSAEKTQTEIPNSVDIQPLRYEQGKENIIKPVHIKKDEVYVPVNETQYIVLKEGESTKRRIVSDASLSCIFLFLGIAITEYLNKNSNPDINNQDISFMFFGITGIFILFFGLIRFFDKSKSFKSVCSELDSRFSSTINNESNA